MYNRTKVKGGRHLTTLLRSTLLHLYTHTVGLHLFCCAYMASNMKKHYTHYRAELSKALKFRVAGKGYFWNYFFSNVHCNIELLLMHEKMSHLSPNKVKRKSRQTFLMETNKWYASPVTIEWYKFEVFSTTLYKMAGSQSKLGMRLLCVSVFDSCYILQEYKRTELKVALIKIFIFLMS